MAGAARSRGASSKGVARAPGGGARKRAKGARKPRAKPPMVYEDPQPQAAPSPPVEPSPEPARALRAAPLEADVVPPRAGAKAPPARARLRLRLPWRRGDDVRLRCRRCGHGNRRDAAACEQCRALL